MTTFHTQLPQWTEGVCGDGAAILRDGVMVPIEEVIARLNQAEARAALSAPEQGPTDAELIWLADQIEDEGLWQVDLVRRALTRWGRPAVEPVPVAERLPGPEDRDVKGRCWWLAQPVRYAPTWVLQRPRGSLLAPFIAWAPHWALPLSQEGE